MTWIMLSTEMLADLFNLLIFYFHIELRNQEVQRSLITHLYYFKLLNTENAQINELECIYYNVIQNLYHQGKCEVKLI
jgi:hypothetical protein